MGSTSTRLISTISTADQLLPIAYASEPNAPSGANFMIRLMNSNAYVGQASFLDHWQSILLDVDCIVTGWLFCAPRERNRMALWFY